MKLPRPADQRAADPLKLTDVMHAYLCDRINVRRRISNWAWMRSWEKAIVVAVLTYERIELLNRLLDEFSRLAMPARSSVVLLVIDNDEAGSAEPIVDSWRERIPNLRYLIERRRGIPVARNRAIAAAEEFEADALCFLDADEFPERDWLVEIVEHWLDTRADLIGGPVFVTTAEAEKSWWKRFVNRSLAARATKKNREVIRKAEQGKRYTIVTNNWLCDLNWLREVGLRFDEQRLVSHRSRINCRI